jgi:hypothetical protein
MLSLSQHLPWEPNIPLAPRVQSHLVDVTPAPQITAAILPLQANAPALNPFQEPALNLFQGSNPIVATTYHSQDHS